MITLYLLPTGMTEKRPDGSKTIVVANYYTATGWLNCEYRSYQFVDPTGKDEDAALRETSESWRRRHGNSIPLTVTEQLELRPLMIEKMGDYLHLINVKN